MYKIMNGMDKGTQSYTENEVYEMFKQDVINHDYSYMMSDSPSVWDSGRQVEATIVEMLFTLVGVCKLDAEALYRECVDIAGPDYNDLDSNGYGLKLRVIRGWFTPYIDLDEVK